jgi:putative spermidine/putrescine transport system permease protein
VTLPLVTISLGLKGIDRSLLEAARVMGAGRWTVMSTVIGPLVLPFIVSGYAFAFVLSLNEYIIAYMVAGFTVETIPIKIFNALRYGYTPILGVVSVLFVLLAALVFGLIGRFGDLPRLMGSERGPRE